MGKKIKLREAQRQRAAETISAVLAAHPSRRAAPALVIGYDDFTRNYRDRIEAYRDRAVRAPEKWRCRIKSRCEDARFADLVRFVFARYPLAPHFGSVWIDDRCDTVIGQPLPGADFASPRAELRDWYLIAGQGGSLYERAAHRCLNRGETHHFLAAPLAVTTTAQAFWYAIARAETADVQAAVTVAGSKLSGLPIGSDFWKDAARFFARQPVAEAEINDFIDFLDAERHGNPSFSLKGRSLAALRRLKEEWHRRLQAEAAGCGGAWTGRDIPDTAYATRVDEDTALWRFRQVKTGLALYEEGRRMSHCVASYHSSCMRGDLSIWSMTMEYPAGQRRSGVTVEVRKDGAIVQCHGYANRAPNGEEVAMIAHWALQFGLSWRA